MPETKSNNIDEIKIELIRVQEREKYNSKILTDRVRSIEEKKAHEAEKERLSREIKEQQDMINRITLEMGQLREYVNKIQDEAKHKLEFEKEFINTKYELEAGEILQLNKQYEKANQELSERLKALEAENEGLKEAVRELMLLKGELEKAGLEKNELVSERESLKAENASLKGELEKLNQDKELIYLEFTRKVDEIIAENKLAESQFELRLKRAREECDAKEVACEKTVAEMKLEIVAKRQEIDQLSLRFENRERNYIHRIYEINGELEQARSGIPERDAKIIALADEIATLKTAADEEAVRVEREKAALKAAAEKQSLELRRLADKAEILEKKLLDFESKANLKAAEVDRDHADALAKKDAELKTMAQKHAEEQEKMNAKMNELESFMDQYEREKQDRAKAESSLNDLKVQYVRLDQEYRKLFRKAKILLLFEKPLF